MISGDEHMRYNKNVSLADMRESAGVFNVKTTSCSVHAPAGSVCSHIVGAG